ncbi:MAG: hypothetical protein GF381_01035 [Candidatus Pacebacteria bacterium]|nr:hypothetical protein [Candidatus Paceibacterota bacterium]
MIIYFVASITGRKKYEDNYRLIVEILEEMGHTVISDHIFETKKNELESEVREDRVAHHKKLSKWLNKADAMIAEVSYPSVSVGYEIGLALDKNKPVLALHTKDTPPAALMGETSDRFIIVSYDVHDLKRDLKYLIDDLIDQQDTRFNFFISPKHQNYLDWIAKHRRIPRSVFLRRLIEKHMDENPHYNKK